MTKRATWFKNTNAASIGIEIVVAVTLGGLGGYFLERHVTHWSPWTMLIGFAVGIGAATKALIRTARNYERAMAAEKDEQRGESDA